METMQISSLKELQLQMPRIIEKYGTDKALVETALANPLLALEKVGYSFTPEARTEIENHVRFGKEKAASYTALKQSIKEAGLPEFQTGNILHIKESLAGLLKPGSKAAIKNKPYTDELFQALDQPVTVINQELKDPLEAYTSYHPVIEKLVELRKTEALYPPLATPEALQKVQQQPSIFNKLTFRISRK